MRLLITALVKMQISPLARTPLKGEVIRSWNLTWKSSGGGGYKGVVTILLFIQLFQESMMLFQKVKKRLSKPAIDSFGKEKNFMHLAQKRKSSA